jgi:Flp pilus assembly protein TadG
MSRLLQRLGRDRRGATAAEFALSVPVALLIIVAFIQMGVLFFANAGMQNALNEGARAATLWPRRDAAQIRTEINAARFGLNPDLLGEPRMVFGTEGGQDFVEITLTYTPELNFLFFEVDALTLTHTRRAYRP